MRTVRRDPPPPPFSAGVAEARQLRQDIHDVMASGHTRTYMETVLGIPRSTLWRWERGTYAPPMLEIRAVLRKWGEDARQQQSSS